VSDIENCLDPHAGAPARHAVWSGRAARAALGELFCFPHVRWPDAASCSYPQRKLQLIFGSALGSPPKAMTAGTPNDLELRRLAIE